VARRLPPRSRVWLRDKKQRMRLRAGETVPEVWGVLVPEARLKQVYHDALTLLAEREGTTQLGDYLEFGVYVGTSVACMHEVVQDRRLDDMRLFGFDSFEGLPERLAVDEETTQLGNWKPFDLKAPFDVATQNLTRRGVDWDRVTLVKGWFEDTLTQELVEREQLRKASIIMVDCDLYSSARTALEFCAPLIRDDAVILFDDWWPETLGKANVGEKLAFEEFLAEHPRFGATELESYRPEAAKVFLVSRRNVTDTDTSERPARTNA
jgi:O-methyltransferase